MSLANGAIFAGYTVVRLLGSGAMGEVYLAQHPRLPRRDALKVLSASLSGEPDYRKRFAREADLACNLWHPHIVGVHDRGEYEGQLWIAMDYVEGTDAARLLVDRSPAAMPAHEVAAIVTAIGGALDYAHRQGLLHRDVKPANIMIANSGDDAEQRILLADFGIARTVGEISGLTATNTTIGTVAYAAPEQLMGEEIDSRADQYALAATAYHLLTGAQLFPYSNPAVVISHHLNTEPPKVSDARPEVAGLDLVLCKALSKDRANRFERCNDFADAFAEQVTPHRQFPVAPTAPWFPPTRPAAVDGSKGSGSLVDTSSIANDGRRSRPRWRVPAAVGVVVAFATVLAMLWRPWDSARPSSIPRAAPTRTALPTSSGSAPTSASPFPASEINTVLLTPTEINTLAASPTDPLMRVRQTTHGMLNNTNLVNPPACVGVIFTGERAVFADSGFEAMLDQTLEPSDGFAHRTTELTQVQQSVVAYPTSEEAQAILNTSQQQWQSCASETIKLGTVGQAGENNLQFEPGNVQLSHDVLTVSMVANSQESGGSACQQAMAIRANIVVSVRACRYPKPPPGQLNADVSSVSNDAERLAVAMLDKITTPPSALPSAPSATPEPSPPTSALPAGGTSGLPCNASNAARLGHDPNSGHEIVCVNQALTPSSPPSWQWAQPPPMTTGVHSTGTSCDPQSAQIMSRSPDGYLIVCSSDYRGGPSSGYWQHYLGPLE
ncbi:Serine/threonine-protein kinase PknF [Mycobacterium marinum]|uniref:serine/threonine-protein kinase PknH/PknJ n=1 Tax=Mycobacterium marinum TaxID=1781 RepID=UPI000E3D2AD6|nr:serine/threonine-protein kinase PknH/PknJ [Mycobacterium marinum]RFZ63182.1 Serine/threonine-protein kinase PknF [Mycobacterium marinum]